MTQTNEISIERLHQDVHEALKTWSKDSTEVSPLHGLTYFQQIEAQSLSSQQATNQVILDALEVLKTKHPKDVDLLRKRFIDEQAVYQVANYFSVGQSTLYNMQKKAITNLAQVLLAMEDQAIAKQQAAVKTAKEQALLERRLEPPTYRDLIGVSSQLSKLHSVLVGAKWPCMVSIEGIGGIGKTSLADALVRSLIGQGSFSDFGWVSAQQNILNLGGCLKPTGKPALTVETLVEVLVEQLLDFTPAQLSGKDAFDALHHRLKEQAHLIVIDNLETMLDVDTLLPTLRRLANPTKFLLTSRKSLYGEADVYHFVVPPLSQLDTLQLIRHEAEGRNLTHLVEASDDALWPIYEMVGGNPLAVRLVVGQTHIHRLDVILSDLLAARGEKVENLYTYIYRRAWDNLDETTRQAFLLMPLAIDEGNDLEYLQAISELEADELRRALDLLVSLNLVDLRGPLGQREYSIHNLTRTFLHEQVAKWKQFL